MLRTYTEAIRNMADELEKPFVDLFHPTRTLMAENFQSPLTINGIHLTEKGYKAVGGILGAEMGWRKPEDGSIDEIRSLIIEKNRQFFLRWRPVNSEYIFGRRNQPFGVITYPPEMKELDQQIMKLDARIHRSAKKLHDSTGLNR